jgi:hypothetical protein
MKKKSIESMLPQDLSDSGIVFGAPTKINSLLPKYSEIPEEFKGRSTPQTTLVSSWFFLGMTSIAFLKEKPGIDRHKALRHIKTCMGSWAPKHEHKTAGCAYLFYLWFEPFTVEDVKANEGTR